MLRKQLISLILLGLLFSATMAVNKKTLHMMKQRKSPKYSSLLQMNEGLYPALAEYTGRSYDLFYGNPLSDTVDEGFVGRVVFDLTYSPDKKTSDDLFYVPNQVTATMDLSCSYSSESKEYSSMKSYQEDLQSETSVKGKVNGLVAKVSFSASTAYAEMEDSVSTREEVTIISQARCSLYKGVITPLATTLSQDFYYDVEKAFTRNTTASWDEFVSDWGTHYASTVVYGAKAIRKTTFSKQSFQKMKSLDIDVSAAVSAKYGSVRGSASTEVSMSQVQQNAFSSSQSSTTAAYVGQPPPESTDIMEWLSSITSGDIKPVPIKFELNALSDLFTQRYFGSRYSTAQLASMKDSFDAAIIRVAQKLDQVPAMFMDLFPAKAVITESPFMGGSIGGNVEKDRTTDYLMLKMTKVKWCENQNVLTSIRLTVGDGTFTSDLKIMGDCTGTFKEFALEEGEEIKNVKVNAGDTIKGLVFNTNKGRASPIIGAMPSQGPAFVDINGDLIGLKARYNSTNVIGLSFLTKTIDYAHTTSVIAAGTDSYGAPVLPSYIFFKDPDRIDANAKITKISLRCGSWVDGISSTGILSNGKTFTNAYYGGSGGSSFDYYPQGRITKVSFQHSGSVIGMLRFHTAGGVSRTCGETAGTNYTVDIPGNLTGFYGYYDSGYLRRLGLLYTIAV